MWRWGIALVEGEPRTDPEPVVNGQIEMDYPASLGLLKVGPDYVFCGGSLITPRLVLTAAHCYQDYTPEEVLQLGRAIVGTHASEAEATLAFVDTVIHPDYQPFDGGSLGENDVRLLELAEDAPIEPVWFRTEPIKPKAGVGEQLVLVGWGMDENGGVGVKRSASLTISEVDPMFLRTRTIDNEHGANSCDGDSGSPLYHLEEDGTLLQWSVHAWGDCGPELGEVDESGSTRVDKVSDWLLEEIERVHGTADRCEIFGQYGDGVCHDDCVEIDEDCPPLEEPPTEEVPAGCAHSSAPASLPPLALIALLRRRPATTRYSMSARCRLTTATRTAEGS